jgi:hypothetical protein
MRWISLLVLVAIWLAGSAPARADDLPEQAFQSIITHQLNAMAKDDNAAAYSDAAPNVQAIFPSADIFMNMVRNGYPPVYRNKSFSFTGTGTDPNGRVYEKVAIEGADGVAYKAYYFMEQQPDGSWKISGCVVLKDQDSV